MEKSPLLDLLRKYFGYDSFRPHQEEVCQSIVHGKDVLLVMPTGAGKSLCYQLPGVARGGTTIVVSPLLALIEDQVEKLKKMGIFAERIHSGRDRKDLRDVCHDYLLGKLQFLFIAPERLSVPGFIEMLKKRPPSSIAVDEAHCISQWGHDFRPDYRLLGERIREFRPAPVVALTATATPLVQDDICKQLGLINEVRSIHGFRRTNIGIHVIEMNPSDRIGAIQSLLQDPERLPAIVYAPTRKVADLLYETLKSVRKVGVYHAGMVASERDKNQDLFLKGQVEVIVATVAFGMGVDKANIRTVIHAALPASVEGYYQEIGRAGRDGKFSQAILLCSYSDQRTHDFFFERDYPDVALLRKVFERLTDQKISKSTLKESLTSIESEAFEKSLEKLWVHRGAVIDFEENVSLGQGSWEKTYLQQRDHKKRQTSQMVEYVRGTQCRMISLIRYFGDQNDSGDRCGSCDSCVPGQLSQVALSRPLSIQEQNLVAEMMSILAGGGELAAGRVFQELVQNHPDLGRQEMEKLLRVLALASWIDISHETFEKEGKSIPFRKIRVTAKGRKVHASDLALLQISEAPSKAKAKKSIRSKKEKSSKSLHAGHHPMVFSPLFEAIKGWRLSEARKKGVPAFRILSDRVALALCEVRPTNEASLLKINGVGPKFNLLYGPEILRLIQKN